MINVHWKNTDNLGDNMCAAGLYFPIGERFDIDDDKPDGIAVYGGGCVVWQAYKEAKARPVILWGGGSTGDESIVHPDYSAFVLSGSRDAGAGSDYWVACPSCMSELFDNPPEPTRNVVEYGHAIKAQMSVNNNQLSFAEAVEHLASAEEIVTSSYHGMVWGTLLGRKVTIKPFGAKFFGWPFGPGKIHSDALEICRRSNIEFFEKVKAYGH